MFQSSSEEDEDGWWSDLEVNTEEDLSSGADDFAWDQHMEEHFNEQCLLAIRSKDHVPGSCDSDFCPRTELEEALYPGLEAVETALATLHLGPTKGGLLLLGYATLVIPFERMTSLALSKEKQNREAALLFEECWSEIQMPSFNVTKNHSGHGISVKSLRNSFAHAELEVNKDDVVLSNSNARKQVVLEFSCSVTELQNYLAALGLATTKFLFGD
jgi:hypothetical protein